MTRPVKRAYDSTLRREQAELTRSRILDAAAALFAGNGYPATTVRAIAERAGVAVDTIYATFGSKPRVLTALIDQRLAPAGQRSVLDTPQALAVRDEPDPRRQLERFAHDIAAISERTRPVFELLRVAAATEPEVAPIYAEMEAQRARNMRRVAEWVADRAPLRVDVERAGEIIWTLTSPDTARLLCDVGGWSTEQLGDWLADALVRLLLDD